jgi:uncharacterized protein (DUF2141 family)
MKRMSFHEKERKLFFTSFLTIVLAGIFLCSPLALSADLTIIIREIRFTKGTIRLTLHDNSSSFDSLDYQAAFAALEIKPKTLQIRITFHDIPSGRYAIVIHHDENDNDKFDMGLLGPSEGYSFSGEWRGVGKPSFDDTALKIDSQNISFCAAMRY